jgi:hypothetical protein
MLTIDRIEEVQQAQVSETVVLARATAGRRTRYRQYYARSCICTVNEALDGVTIGLARVVTYFTWYMQVTSSLYLWIFGYILLFTSPVLFHSFSNTSSHATRTLACSGSMGTLTL